MADDWETVSLGDICTGIYDGPHATPPPSETGAVFLRIENITPSGRLDFSDIRRINDADWGRWTRRITPQSDDVVFSYEANLGLFARIPPGFHGCLGRRLALMRPDPLQVDAGYLLYACLAPEFQELLRQRTVLGSTVDRISLREFPTFEIPLPPLPEQKRIAHILGTLDDKIELNRRMNATLEGISRAIFKSWFVDFDPVRQKAAGKRPVGMDAQTAALFPDSFEDSEIGEVPKGWEVVPLPEIIEVNPGRSLRKGEIAAYLDMANMPTSGHTPDELIARPFGSGTRFMNGDTLVARITPCLENGKTAFIDCLQSNEVAWGSTEFIVLRPYPPLPPEFAYCLARDDGFREFAIQSMTGSSGRQRVPAESLDHFRLARPPAALAEAFAASIQPSFHRIRAAANESRTLAALRDTLLPKLLSGEVRVAEAEVMVEEAVR